MDIPILSLLICVPTVGALFILFTKANSERYNSHKYISIFISLINFFYQFIFGTNLIIRIHSFNLLKTENGFMVLLVIK